MDIRDNIHEFPTDVWKIYTQNDFHQLNDDMSVKQVSISQQLMNYPDIEDFIFSTCCHIWLHSSSGCAGISKDVQSSLRSLTSF